MKRGLLTALAGATAAVAFSAAPAFAATSITTPSTNPYTVPVDSNTNPVPFTIVGTGFTPGSQVFAEICDGKSPTSPGWSPTLDCDLGTSPAQAIADSTGTVTFNGNDPNFQIWDFKGISPSGIFNCLSAEDSPTATETVHGGDQIIPSLPSYTNCQLKLSTSNQNVTADQVFTTLTIPVVNAAQTPESPLPIVLPIVAVGVAGAAGVIVMRRRRQAHAA